MEPKNHNELISATNMLRAKNYHYFVEERPSFIKGRNFVTPNIIGIYKKDGDVIELSWGKAEMLGGYIFGFTVWSSKTGKPVKEKSSCFFDTDDLILGKEA